MAVIQLSYPVDGESVSTDIRQSMRAAHLKALHHFWKNPEKKAHVLAAVELAALTEHLERIVILLEGNCYDKR